jgi:hypothetical protein
MKHDIGLREASHKKPSLKLHHRQGFVLAKLFFFFSVRHYSHDFVARRALQVVARMRVRARRVRIDSLG